MDNISIRLNLVKPKFDKDNAVIDEAVGALIRLTGRIQELEKVIAGPTEEYAVAWDDKLRGSTITMDELAKAAERFNDRSSVLHTCSITITPGLWASFGAAANAKLAAVSAEAKRAHDTLKKIQTNISLTPADGSDPDGDSFALENITAIIEEYDQ